MNPVTVEPINQEYAINQDEGKLRIAQDYNFSNFDEKEQEQIKKRLLERMREAFTNLMEVYGENFQYETQWKEQGERTQLLVVVETDNEIIGLDLSTSTLLATFMHKSPKNAYMTMIENLKWVENHYSKEIDDLFPEKVSEDDE